MLGLGMADAGEDRALLSGGGAQDASAPRTGQRLRGGRAAPLLSARIPPHLEAAAICGPESARARGAGVRTGWDTLWGRDEQQGCVKVRLGLYATPYLLTPAPRDRSQSACRNLPLTSPGLKTPGSSTS